MNSFLEGGGRPAVVIPRGAEPAWEDCDVFCINNYAATSGPACGWRGAERDAIWDAGRRQLLCPRCRSAQLLEVPRDGSGPDTTFLARTAGDAAGGAGSR